MPVNKELKEKLQRLAKKYENSTFPDADPSQFLRYFPLTQKTEVECASFIAAMLSFGNRSQFIPKIHKILELAKEFSPHSPSPLSTWLISGAPNFPTGPEKFYRFYSYDDLHLFFSEIADILSTNNSLGDYFKSIYVGKAFPSLQSPADFSATPSSGGKELSSITPQRPIEAEANNLGVCPHANSSITPGVCPPANSSITTGVCPLTLDKIISASFPKSKIVPKGKNSANKRIHMFLRWMVRQNSPVDLGIWSWYPQSSLIIPLDIHVMQESINLGLIAENSKATYKTAQKLTNTLSEIFPGDPCKGDYALFGYGVDKS